MAGAETVSYALQDGLRAVPVLLRGSHSAALVDTFACTPEDSGKPDKLLEVWPNLRRAKSMFKFIKRAWGLVRNGLGAYRLYELLRDHWNELL